MSPQPLRGAFAHKLPHAVSYRAWRIGKDNPHHEATPVDLPEVVETADQAAQIACLHRGEMVLVLRSDDAERPERRHALHIYQTKTKTNPPRRWNLATSRFETAPAEYPALIGIVCVGEGFSPSEPWRWTPGGDATGRDTTLIEGRTA